MIGKKHWRQLLTPQLWKGSVVVAIICPSMKLTDYIVAFTSYWKREMSEGAAKSWLVRTISWVKRFFSKILSMWWLFLQLLFLCVHWRWSWKHGVCWRLHVVLCWSFCGRIQQTYSIASVHAFDSFPCQS